MKRIFASAILCFCFLMVKAQVVQVDAGDSILVEDEPCIATLYKGATRITDASKITVTAKNGKVSSLSKFLESANVSAYGEHGLVDIDKDGTKELIISNYTGGAHCCDELYIFKNTAPNRYQYVTKFFAGNTCVTPGGIIFYDLYENFGYFFTCYACQYPDTTSAAPVSMQGIVFTYKNGKIAPQPGDNEMKEMIMKNLEKLSKQPYESLDDIAQDNGLRKEFAFNLANHYYSFGKNMGETQKLFEKYYKYPDASKVWAEFTRIIQHIRSKNEF